MKIAVICGMSDEKVHARLLPLVELDEVEEIFLIRRKPIHMPKVDNLSLPGWMQKTLAIAEIYRFLALFLTCLIKRPAILYGIYFVPHGIYAAIAGWIFRKPVIQELIGTDRLKVMQSKILFSMLTSADKVGVRGQRSREQLLSGGIPEAKFFTPISVNALDFNHFRPDDNPKVYDLVYCGRMDKNKQLDIIIKAIAELRPSFPHLKAVFVGDGPERENLEALTDALGLTGVITFTGNSPYEQIPNYLNQSRIFVMASAFEGLPVAMIEALSCGLPVVVPYVGDIADLAQHGFNALLVEQIDMYVLANALKSLLGNDPLYQQLMSGALKTRQQLIKTYTLDKARADFRQIIAEIT